jgi:hypothetical protein
VLHMRRICYDSVLRVTAEKAAANTSMQRVALSCAEFGCGNAKA